MSIQDIISKYKPLHRGLFFVGHSIFFLSDIYNKNTGESVLSSHNHNFAYPAGINDDSVIILEAGNTHFVNNSASGYLDSDDYYFNATNYAPYGLIMHLPHSKMKKDIRHLAWHVQKCHPFSFFVFGQLTSCGGDFYNIVPLAVWQ